MTDTTASTDVPVIDFTPLLEDEVAGKHQVASEVYDALTQVGFMYVRNAGMPQRLRDRAFQSMANFFARPSEVKEALAWTTPEANRGYVGPGRQALDPKRPGDLKEAFDTGWELDSTEGERARVQVNRWPADAPEFRETILTFYRYALQSAHRVLSTMEAALALEPNTFVGTHQHHNHTLRLLHYPPISEHTPEPRQIRAGAHTDFGSVTLLFQDGLGGLEVRERQNRWISAPAFPDAILVNTGDCMERWTNDVFRSTAHRVAMPSATEATQSRHSIAFFCSPDPETEIQCLPNCLDEGGTEKYPPIRAKQHLVNRLDQTYGKVS